MKTYTSQFYYFNRPVISSHGNKFHNDNALLTLEKIYTVSAKREQKMFVVISSTEVGQFGWNLVFRLAAKSGKRFPPHDVQRQRTVITHYYCKKT